MSRSIFRSLLVALIAAPVGFACAADVAPTKGSAVEAGHRDADKPALASKIIGNGKHGDVEATTRDDRQAAKIIGNGMKPGEPDQPREGGLVSR